MVKIAKMILICFGRTNKVVLDIFTKYYWNIMTLEKKIITCPRCKKPNSVDAQDGHPPKGLKCVTCGGQIS